MKFLALFTSSRCQTSTHIVCIEYDWRQAASEALSRKDEREHVVMHHTAA